MFTRRSVTLDEFFAWEERQDIRYEFDGIRPVAITGGTLRDAAIRRNLAIGGRLRGAPCQFYGNDLKSLVAGRRSLAKPDGMQRHPTRRAIKRSAAAPEARAGGGGRP